MNVESANTSASAEPSNFIVRMSDVVLGLKLGCGTLLYTKRLSPATELTSPRKQLCFVTPHAVSCVMFEPSASIENTSNAWPGYPPPKTIIDPSLDHWPKC